jgi:formate-dependent nitrite reductase membrane component NrfD
VIEGLSSLHWEVIPRENPAHWEWLVYLEMFVAGTAAGAYVMAGMLELLGRGRSSLARTAHLIAFPLMALAGILLIVDLDHPERFWHMVVQSQTMAPMLKTWSPMSAGSWAVLLFPAFAFVSFVDALIARRMFSLGGWRYDRTLHGTTFGLVWSVLGGVVAFFVAAYSGVLLNVTNFGGWSDSMVPLAGALYLATAALTGMAAVLLIEALRGLPDRAESQGLSGAITLVALWWIVLLVLFVATLGPQASRVLLAGASLLAIVGGAVLGGVLPLLLFRFLRAGSQPGLAAITALLILVGGLLLRAGVVMGPQHG